MSSPSSRTCYTRNGTTVTDISYQPCISDPSRDSVCCGTNHQGAGQLNVANDVCDPNGLCQNFEAYDGTNAGVKNWWRQGCTDPTWESESCLKNVCNFDKWQVDNAPVQRCGDSGWCCGEKSCCSIPSSVFRLAATLAPTVASSSLRAVGTSVALNIQSSNSMAPITASSTPTASASPAADPNAASSSSGLSTGVKAGIGSGVAVVAILLIVIAFLVMKLRKRKQWVEKGTGDVAPVAKQEQQYYAHEYQTGPAEMLAVDKPVEMVGSRYVAELPGSHGVE